MVGGVRAAKHRRDASDGQWLATLVREVEAIAHGLAAELLDGDGDGQHVLEERGLLVIAGRRHAGETELAPWFSPVHAQAALAEERSFGGFHEAEEVGEVHDAGHVGVTELDAAGGLEWSHDFILRLEVVADRDRVTTLSA